MKFCLPKSNESFLFNLFFENIFIKASAVSYKELNFRKQALGRQLERKNFFLPFRVLRAMGLFSGCFFSFRGRSRFLFAVSGNEFFSKFSRFSIGKLFGRGFHKIGRRAN